MGRDELFSATGESGSASGSSEPGCEQYTNADHGAGSSVGRPGCAGAGTRCIECPAVPQNMVVIVILDVVVVDS